MFGKYKCLNSSNSSKRQISENEHRFPELAVSRLVGHVAPARSLAREDLFKSAASLAGDRSIYRPASLPRSLACPFSCMEWTDADVDGFAADPDGPRE